ncbi:MAG: 2-dehydro-3-deoxyphosphogluconate aldolase, partial [Candidatus Aminicenantes bacterium]
MTKDKVLNGILAAKAVAVIRMTDAAKLAKAAAALRKGGVTALEVTMTVPG